MRAPFLHSVHPLLLSGAVPVSQRLHVCVPTICYLQHTVGVCSSHVRLVTAHRRSTEAFAVLW